jgi:hypothetical protein
MWREGVSPSHFTRGAGVLKKFWSFLGKTTREFQNLEIYRGLKPRGKVLLKSPVHVVKIKINKNAF